MRAVAFPLAACALVVACSAPSQRGALPPVSKVAAGIPKSPIVVKGMGTDPALDRLVVKFMASEQVPNAQLAVSVRGATTFSHAYTYRGLAKSTTERSTIMRLASNTKAWTSGALYNLIQAHKIDPNAKVFEYLGITKPLPRGAKVDKRVYQITIEDKILHESGWDDSKPPYYDPTFHMRDIALALHLKHEVDPVSYVRYQLHEPLQEPPGTTYAYCN
ncbi:MAG: beta-lactamase family protein, partial [Candidatus Eremiobacteraeota bacterium]|nr:beta-lactamase family protein [Candidatus Eremiobacteraeota bacterium]